MEGVEVVVQLRGVDPLAVERPPDQGLPPRFGRVLPAPSLEFVLFADALYQAVEKRRAGPPHLAEQRGSEQLLFLRCLVDEAV